MWIIFYSDSLQATSGDYAFLLPCLFFLSVPALCTQLPIHLSNHLLWKVNWSKRLLEYLTARYFAVCMYYTNKLLCQAKDACKNRHLFTVNAIPCSWQRFQSYTLPCQQFKNSELLISHRNCRCTGTKSLMCIAVCVRDLLIEWVWSTVEMSETSGSVLLCEKRRANLHFDGHWTMNYFMQFYARNVPCLLR